MMMTRSLFVAAVALVSGLAHVEAATDPCRGLEVDLCATHLVAFSKGPTSSGRAAVEADLERVCAALTRADKCFRNYTKTCTTGLQRQMMNMWFSGPANMHDRYCTPGSEPREQYITHSECLRKAFNDGKQTCMKDMKVAFEHTSTVKWDKRQALTCCAYNRGQECMDKLVKKECGVEGITFVRDLMRVGMSRLPDIICHDFTGKTRICRELPPVGSALRGGPTTNALNKFLTTYIGVV